MRGNKVKESVLHLYLYGLFKREIGGGNRIHISQIHPIVKWAIRVPRKIQKDFIDELVEVGLLTKVGRDTFELVTIKRKPLCDSLGNPLWG